MQGGYLLYSSPNLSKMFIKKISLPDQQPFVFLVDETLEAKKKGIESSNIEKQIDELFYQIYDITPAEQKIIEGEYIISQ